MSIPDKIAAANKINDLLKGLVSNSGLRLKYRITVDPPLQEDRDWGDPRLWWNLPGRTRRCCWSEGGTAALDRIPGARNAPATGKRA